MNREQFKQRMKSLKSYREQNPDKGYWDWKVEQFEEGGIWLPEVEVLGTYPRKQYVYDRANFSQANFIQRAKNINRNTIPDWKVHNAVATHKLSYAEDGGKYIVYPEVQEINGSLYDFTDPKNGHYRDRAYRWTDALDSAINRGDTLTFDRESDARYFTEHYKEHYPSFEKGGEVPPDNSPVHVNPFTKKPLANGAITPVLDLEGAANFTPAGDVLSIRDAYVAAKNNDLLGLGLAGLGFLPFVPRIGRSKVSKVNKPPIPEVHPNYFQEQMEKAERAAAKRKQTVNDFYTQQDQAYESLIENEDAFRRAVNADASAGTNYTGVYGDYLRNYSRSSSQYNDNLTSIRLTDDIPSEAKAQVDPRNLNWIRVNSRYADPDELDPVFQQMNPGLVRHELGHVTDEKAGLDYVNKLGNRSKFESESKLKEMFPKTYKRVQDYLLRGSEIKSHMNEFRDYLYSIGQYSSTETAKSLRQKLDKYGSNFKNLKTLFDAYKNKRQFARDYNTIPLIGTSALGINYYLNQEEQRRD